VGFPFYACLPLVFPPSRSVSRRLIWAGARGDNLLVGPGTPRGRNADTLVPDVVALEAEEGVEPVHEALVGAPRREGRRAEAAHRPERRRGSPHLGEPERRVLG
jgi:hypothetical protein